MIKSKLLRVTFFVGLLACSLNISAKEFEEKYLAVVCSTREYMYERLTDDGFTPFILGAEDEDFYNEVWYNTSIKKAVHLKTSVESDTSCVVGVSKQIIIRKGKEVNI